MQEHRITHLQVIKAEHKNSREVEVTYEDGSKKTFNPVHYQRMHREVVGEKHN